MGNVIAILDAKQEQQLSPQSAYLQAGHLYDRYKEYFNIR